MPGDTSSKGRRRHSRAELARLVRAGARKLEQATAHEIAHWAAHTFGDRLAVASSMQDAVLAHLASSVAPGQTVLFLDTGYHFAETLGTRDAIEATLPIEVLNLRAHQTTAEQDSTYGPELYKDAPERCCRLRKVEPLDRALQGFDAWMTGARREETAARADAPVITWDPRRGVVKIMPLARWTDEDVDRYIAEHNLIVNPLKYEGYPSIGCWPCTSRVEAGEGSRSGRWAGLAKNECGINF